MPTIDVNYVELQHLLNTNLGDDIGKLDEILANIKGEVKSFDQKANSLSIEMKDTNRPDLWSIEGLIRGLRGYINQEKGIKSYNLNESTVQVNVDADLYSIRPFIG